MTNDEFDRTARLWLEDGPTIMSDHALRSAFDEIHVTRQRRSWWPARRISPMNPAIRLALSAGAVILAVTIGLSLLPGGAGFGGGPAPTPTPTPVPTPTPITLQLYPSDAPAPRTATYRAGVPFPIPATMTVPSGWAGWVGGEYAAFIETPEVLDIGGAAVHLTLGQTFYADPCHGTSLLDPQPGPSVDDLVTALTKLPGFTASTPTPVTIDGYAGKQLTLSAPVSFADCTLTEDGYLLMKLPGGATFSSAPGQETTLRILDVNGRRLVISSDVTGTTPGNYKTDVETIIDSMTLQ